MSFGSGAPLLLKESTPSTLIVFQKGLLDEFMGRFLSPAGLLLALTGCAFLAGCGHSSPTVVSSGNAVPTSVSLASASAVGSNLSLEISKTAVVTATARGANNNIISETFSFQSSDPTILTIASNGDLCAGTWDSLTNPTVCTPGNVGVAEVTAVAQGVSSPPLTVYVHQRITNISVSKAPLQAPTLSNICLSKGAAAGPESWVYQATAMSGSTDITSSVGPFFWQQINPSFSGNIVTLSATTPGPPSNPTLNQEVVTAATPGQSMIFASASGFSSPAVPVETCPVQTISIVPANSSSTSLLVNTGTTTALNATVTDILGMTLTGVPLTWSSSNSISVSVTGATSSVYGSVGNTSTPSVGGAAVTASCTPPTCNGGIKPSLPIYPQSAISFTVRSGTAPTNPVAYVTTTACTTGNPTNATCNPTIIPLTKSSTTSSFATGSPIVLPFSPNSFLFNSAGTSAYLGVDSSHFNQNGVMVFTGSTVSQFNTAAGRILAVSPDGTTVIISDTADIPNQVFICTNCSGTGRSIASFLISGATAAAFSPDNLKAYIVAGTNLYVYSKVDAMQKVTGLAAPVRDVAFLSDGIAGYFAGGDPAGGAFLGTCNPPTPAAIGSVSIPGAKMIHALPQGNEVLALAPPNLFTVDANVNVAPNPPVGALGCPSPRGFVTITNSTSPAFDLGQGAFIPTQLIVSGDGATAYILGETTPPPNPTLLPFLIAFDIGAQTSSLISLSGNASPLSASLSPAGNLLFVGANDGAVHIIDTSSGQDTQQITFPFASAPLCFGPGTPATQVAKSSVTLTSASFNAGNTTYSYAPISGPALQVGQQIVISGMTDGGNNGTYTISAVGAGTFTVANQNGVTTTSTQNGLGIVPITCNPDLVVVKP